MSVGSRVDRGAETETSVERRERSRRTLELGVARIRARLQALERSSLAAAPEISAQPEVRVAEAAYAAERDEAEFPTQILAAAFGLSRFERDVLELCAAIELDGELAAVCARLHGGGGPSFALASTLLEGADFGAMLPQSPLRHWRLIETVPGDRGRLATARLAVDERILGFLKGLNQLDARVLRAAHPVAAIDAVVPFPASHEQLAEEAVAALVAAGSLASAPVIRLDGRSQAAKEAVAARAAARLGLMLLRLDAAALPADRDALDAWSRLWQRESRLLPLALHIVVDHAAASTLSALTRFLAAAPGVYFLDVEPDTRVAMPNEHLIEVVKPSTAEQRTLWLALLGSRAAAFCGRASEHFSFDSQTILRLAATSEADSEGKDLDRLWRACRHSARRGLDALALRIDARAGWDDLIMPPDSKAQLGQIVAEVRHRHVVYGEWGFRARMSRGLGISVLFAGESGTGKTMAAEVIANALDLDLYRIDQSAVISKYVGETSKNIRRIFDAAENCGAILFFDEADAIFGKRSEVKDSHDRYANAEIAYLLQRMEAYSGLAILATNFRKALDQAFVRRLRFIVQFERPSAAERAEIWRRAFPPAVPVGSDFDAERLAELQVTGASVHSIALHASFMAAEQGCAVSMPIILAAAKTEFAKLQRPAKETCFEWSDSKQQVRAAS